MSMIARPYLAFAMQNLLTLPLDALCSAALKFVRVHGPAHGLSCNVFMGVISAPSSTRTPFHTWQ
jgi:hypothetical protein